MLVTSILRSSDKAISSGSEIYWIGKENRAFATGTSDKDYNGRVVRVQFAPAPEHARVLLLGSG